MNLNQHSSLLIIFLAFKSSILVFNLPGYSSDKVQSSAPSTNKNIITEREPEKLKKIKEWTSDIDRKFSVPKISASQLLNHSNKDKDVVIVDVRSNDEIQVSKIPGAISLEQFRLRSDSLKNKEIIAYCTIGYRSSKFVRSILSKFPKAKNLEGSIISWVHAGGKIVDSNENETKRIHAYGRSQKLLPSSFKSHKDN